MLAIATAVSEASLLRSPLSQPRQTAAVAAHPGFATPSRVGLDAMMRGASRLDEEHPGSPWTEHPGRSTQAHPGFATLLAEEHDALPEGHEYLIRPRFSRCAHVYLEDHPELALPRMVVVAKDPPLTDDAITELLDFLEDVFDTTEGPFSILWEVRGRAFPSMKQFWRVVDWLGRDGRHLQWDERVQGNAAVIRSRLLRGTARLMVRVTRPPQPSHIASDVEGAHAWARDHLTVAQDFRDGKSAW